MARLHQFTVFLLCHVPVLWGQETTGSVASASLQQDINTDASATFQQHPAEDRLSAAAEVVVDTSAYGAGDPYAVSSQYAVAADPYAASADAYSVQYAEYDRQADVDYDYGTGGGEVADHHHFSLDDFGIGFGEVVSIVLATTLALIVGPSIVNFVYMLLNRKFESLERLTHSILFPQSGRSLGSNTDITTLLKSIDHPLTLEDGPGVIQSLENDLSF